MTVILANGDFPAPGTEARRLLESASRVVACDGAADAYFAHYGRMPDFTVGDLDSISGGVGKVGGNIVRVEEQDTNDLAKAARFCRDNGWWPPLVLGATGKREDHTIANLFLALDLGLEVVTGEGRFTPVSGTRRFSAAPGVAVSVFAPDPATQISSQGLQWPLDGLSFPNLYCASLNRAPSGSFTITSSRPVLVFVAD